MYKIMAALLLICLASCKDNSTASKTPDFSLRDSVLQRYIARADSSNPYDSTDMNYKMLRAYANNDLAFFRKAQMGMDRSELYSYPDPLDSCVLPRNLSDMPVDEAYRFIHSESFCIFGQSITISRSGDSINLHYAEYILPDPDRKPLEITFKNGDHYIIKTHCQLVKEFDKTLVKKDWELFEEKVGKADYWGLRKYSYNLVLDGSSWQVDAFRKLPRYPDERQIHSVYRHSPRSEEFMNIGKFMLKLSGEKTMCEELR